MHPVFEYLKFLFRSTNQHGVHSPFVYDLLTKGLYLHVNASKKREYQAFRSALLHQKETINVTDFGAGSRVFKSNTRSIAAIAKHAGISKKRGVLLMKLMEYFQPQNILEIGTSVGLGTAAMAIGQPKATIKTLEGCAETAKVAEKAFKKFNLHHIEITQGDFSNTLSDVLQREPFDFIYFDGHHQKEATLQYFETCLSYCHNDSLFLFDDIYWSAGMKSAWEQIKAHPKVTVTIDSFHWGMVFFRKEQAKEHFTIRL